MSSKVRSRLEADIDKYRTESNWRKVQELLQILKKKQSGSEAFQQMVEGELFLETQIDNLGDRLSPNLNNAKIFSEAKELLNAAVSEGSNSSHILLESRLLLAKLQYYCASYSDSIRLIEASGMDSASAQFRTLRVLRLIAEGYTIKGLCFEIVEGPGNKKSITCYEQAAELAISYINELEKSIYSSPLTSTLKGTPISSGSTISVTTIRPPEKIGSLFECSLEKVANIRLRNLTIENSFTEQGIEWYRRIVSHLGDKTTGEKIQQRLSLQLAELLCRTIPNTDIHSYALSEKERSLNFYTGNHGGYFMPISKFEEIVLLLLISEAVATRNVVLSRSEDVSAARLNSLRAAKSVYNLLTLTLSTIKKYNLISRVYERAMKFAIDDPHILYQFVLCLINEGNIDRTLRLMDILIMYLADECKPEHAPKFLVAAQFFIQSNGLCNIAMQCAKKAAAITKSPHIKQRADLYHAIALGQICRGEIKFEVRREKLKDVIFQIEKCIDADPHDYLALFYSAAQNAIARNVEVARDRIMRSLELNPDQPCAIMLLALIFTSNSDFKGALEVVVNTLTEFPNHYGLLVIRLHLEKKLARHEEALETAAFLLEIWRKHGISTSAFDVNIQKQSAQFDSAPIAKVGSVTKTGTNISGQNRESPFLAGTIATPQKTIASNQLVANSSNVNVLAALAISELGLNNSQDEEAAFHFIPAQLRAQFRAQANIWTTVAEMYLDDGRYSEVSACVEQAIAMFPLSHQPLYLKGRLLLANLEQMQATDDLKAKMRTEAQALFYAVLAINPSHVESREQLGLMHIEQKNWEAAEFCFRELLRNDPLNCDWWQRLGEVLFAAGAVRKASKAFASAAVLDRTTPLLPFTCIPIVFPSQFS